MMITKKQFGVLLLALMLVLAISYIVMIEFQKYHDKILEQGFQNGSFQGFVAGQQLLMQDICDDGAVTMTVNNVTREVPLNQICGGNEK